MWYNKSMNYFLNIPNKVYDILEELRRGGFDAYVVGGCVRDLLMSRKPDDWDITTSATPDEVKKVFKKDKLVETGLKHGTVTIVRGKESFEVTTFRLDGTYSDGRHPDSVSFSKDIKVDLARRDFTMNALAYSPEKGIIDEYGGIEDIRNKVIRAVGRPEERFKEDSLRILRAIRFAGTLGFMLEAETARAVRDLAGTAGRSSAERIMTEINKLLMGAYAAYAVKAYRHEIDAAVAFANIRIADRRCVRSLEHAPASLPLRLALIMDLKDEGNQMNLFGDSGLFSFAGDLFGARPEVDIDGYRNALKKMKYDNETIKLAAAMKETASKKIEPEDMVVRLEMRKLADRSQSETVPDIMMDGISVRSLQGRLSDSATEKLFAVVQRIVEKGECYSRSQLDITGDDLAEDKELNEAGLKQGKAIGKILSALLDEVIAGELENEHDALMKRAREIYTLVSSIYI